MSKLKKRVAASSSSGGGGKCPCCASTHPARVRGVGDNDNGPSALKKRVLAAEVRPNIKTEPCATSRSPEHCLTLPIAVRSFSALFVFVTPHTCNVHNESLNESSCCFDVFGRNR